MRILIVRLSSMGDIVHALPLAENAHAAGAEVGWAVEAPFAGLLEGNPRCARLFPARTRLWRRRPLSGSTWREIRALRAALRGFAPDWSIDAQGLWKSAVVARTASPRVVGLAARVRREPGSALLCPLRVVPGPGAPHAVERNLALLSAIGVPVRNRAPDASYLLSRPSPEADAFVAGLPRPYAVFHPGAGRPEKSWGEDRFARLAASLSDSRGLHPVVSWGPGDQERAARLSALLPAASRAPLLDFPGLARLLAASSLVVAGDTGPLHLADALGASTLALFGTSDSERNAPAQNGPYRNPAGVVPRMHEVSDQQVLEKALGILEVSGF